MRLFKDLYNYRELLKSNIKKDIRGKYKGFKAMDALQISSAIASRCDMFFTNDKQLRQEKEIPCMTMEDLQ